METIRLVPDIRIVLEDMCRIVKVKDYTDEDFEGFDIGSHSTVLVVNCLYYFPSLLRQFNLVLYFAFVFCFIIIHAKFDENRHHLVQGNCLRRYGFYCGRSRRRTSTTLSDRN